MIFLSALTKAINAYLKLDTESISRLKKLNGKAITIEFLPFHFIFQCIFYEDHIELKTDELLQTETSIRGTPLQMAGVMLAKDNRHQFFADDLTIEGDAVIAQQAIELFDELHIDWEEHLSRLVGDTPAYHLGNVMRDMNQWLKRSKKSFTQNVNEYLHEESQFLPASEALQDFFNEIDTLRMDIDRLEAKLNRLRASLKTSADNEVKS